MSAIAIAVAVSALGVSLFATLLAIGAVLRVQRLERPRMAASGLARDVEAPLHALEGRGTAVDHALAQREQVILFLSSACAPCRDAVEALNSDAIRARLPAALILIEVGASDRSELRRVAPFSAAWIADEGTLATAFAVNAFPFAFLVRHGRVSEAGLASAIIGGTATKSPEPATSPRLGW